MKIVKLGVEAVEGGAIVSLGAFVAANEELQADDVAMLLDTLRASVSAEKPTEEKKPEGNAPTRKRSAASAAPAETQPSAPEPDAGSATGDAPRRRGRPAAEKPAAEEAKPATSKISNLDLAKAMTKLSETIGKDEAMAWLKESYGVDKVADIPADKREECLGLIKEATG